MAKTNQITKTTSNHQSTPVVLSLGMGADSAAIAVRWLDDPTSRNFDLCDLIVLTAMTGDEFDSTIELMDRHVVPRLRAAGARFVQVARASHSDTDGIVVLDDSTAPERVIPSGPVKLSDELRAAGTIVIQGGARKCSQKWKGWVLDKWLDAELGGRSYRHVIGFESEETRRADRDQCYGGAGRAAEYPLIEWGWNRARCLDYLRERTGADWQKSACVHCPYSQGCTDVVDRYRREPEAGADAVELEAVALAFNPRMMLYKTRTVADALGPDHPSIEIAAARAAAAEWGVYRLRRGMKPRKSDASKRGATFRSVAAVRRGLSMAEALSAIGASGHAVSECGKRAVVRDTGAGYPRIEEYLVAAPAVVADKHGRYGADRFEAFMAEVEGMIR